MFHRMVDSMKAPSKRAIYWSSRLESDCSVVGLMWRARTDGLGCCIECFTAQLENVGKAYRGKPIYEVYAVHDPRYAHTNTRTSMSVETDLRGVHCARVMD